MSLRSGDTPTDQRHPNIISQKGRKEGRKRTHGSKPNHLKMILEVSGDGVKLESLKEPAHFRFADNSI